MFKKILTILFLMFLLFISYSFKYKADNNDIKLVDKIYLIGTNFKYEEGLILTSSTLDMNKTGTYNVYYKDDNNNNYIEKVIVTTLDDLEKGLIISNNYLDMAFNNIDIIKIEKYEDDLYFLCYNQLYYYFMKISDNKISYSKELIRKTDGSISDFSIDKNEKRIVYVGTIYSYETAFNVLVGNLDLNLTFFKRRLISGANNDYGLYVTSVNGKTYIAGNTESDDGNFSHLKKGLDAFLIMINTNNLNILSYLDLGKVNNDSVTYLTSNDNYVYLFASYNNNLYLETDITRFNLDLEIQEVRSLPTSMVVTIISSAKSNDGIYFVFSTPTTIFKQCYKYQNDILSKISEDVNKIEIINDNIITTNDNNLIINNDNHIINYELDNDINDVIVVGNKIIYQNDNHLIIDEYDFILLENAKTYISNVQNINGILKINDISNTYYDINHFGIYHLDLIYDNKLYQAVLSKDIKVELNANISNNNIYNIGLFLNFNADAYLNNEKINNNYQINLPGTYEIKFIDVNGNEIKYHIIIENINYNIEEITPAANITNINKDQINKHNIKIEQTQTINNVADKDYNKSLWYILIPSSIILLGIAFYFTIGKRLI